MDSAFLSAPHPAAVSQKNGRGWMEAEEDGVCRADADSFPTGESEAKMMHLQQCSYLFFPKP